MRHEDEGVELEKTKQYALGPGQTQAYASGLIHSTAHPQKAWVIRITGTDLDAIPRYHFRPKTDKIVEGARAPIEARLDSQLAEYFNYMMNWRERRDSNPRPSA